MLLSNYKAISFVLFAAGIILLAYAVFFAWKNRLSRMYRDVKNIESALPVEEAGREVFSAIRAEDLRRYQENSDTGATDTHPRHRAGRASERERTRDTAEPAPSSGFTAMQEGLSENAENSEEETSPFVSYAAEGEATSYMEETGESNAMPAGEDEATSYMGGFSEDEATSYMGEADVPDESEATSYMEEPEEPDESDATSFMEAPDEDDATSYMDDPGKSEDASITDASVEDDAEEATTYMTEEPAEEEDASYEEKANMDGPASEAGKKSSVRGGVSPHTSNEKEGSSEPDQEEEEAEQDAPSDDLTDDPDDNDATTFLADPASREYREDVMDAIYALEEDSEKEQRKGKEENHSAKHKQKPSGSGKKTKKSKDTGEKKKPHAAKKNAGNSEGWFDLEDYL